MFELLLLINLMIGLAGFLVVNITTDFNGEDSHIVDIEATLDADTTATIPHNLGGASPDEVIITPLALAATLSLWRATVINSSNVVLTKSTTAGSGAAGFQVKCIINRPHSIGR